MDLPHLVEIVAQRAELDRDGAERALRATLQTLTERLPEDLVRRLAGRLPPELRSVTGAGAPPQDFGLDEFLRRVSEREQVDVAAAGRHARAVFFALGRALPAEDVLGLAAALPREFAPLVAEAERRDVAVVLPAEEIWARVADRTGLDADGARRVTEAVLETLAERVSAGEVEDLMKELPPELHDPLRRGNALSHGAARRWPLEEFLRRVAEREGVTPEQAREHARAVFATLREALSEKEVSDLTAQLPKEFTAVLPRP